MLFTSALFVGTAVVALWLDHRVPQLAPAQLRWRALCVIVSFFVCGYAPVATGSYLTLYATVFGVLAPLLTLMWLSSLWLLRAASDALASRY
jgi:hypothetical protein